MRLHTKPTKTNVASMTGLRGLSESQRRSELMAGVYLTPGQQLAQCCMGIGLDELHEAMSLDGRDLTGVAAANPKLRKVPTSTMKTHSIRGVLKGGQEHQRFNIGGQLRFGVALMRVAEDVSCSPEEAPFVEDDADDDVCVRGLHEMQDDMAELLHEQAEREVSFLALVKRTKAAREEKRVSRRSGGEKVHYSVTHTA
ncbi:MAG: hypothetical protein Q7S96_01615 [bacterium]|nr:hypothetical protein [bacterium]